MTQNQIRYQEHLETRRHNQEMERLTGESQSETARHNRAYEEETSRTNQANEDIRRQTNVINDAHYLRQDAESVRHDMTVETETGRSNRAQEALAHERNLVAADANQVQRERNQVTREGNLMNVSLGLINANEQAAHNRQTESIQRGQVEVSSERNALEHEDRAEANRISNFNVLSQDQERASSRDLNYQKIRESQSQIALNEARTRSQKTQSFANISRGLNDLTRGAVNVVNIVSRIGGNVNGNETENRGNGTEDWWQRMEEILEENERQREE